jgi:hypothetical protein
MKAEVTLDPGEELSIARLELAVHRIALDPVGLWNIELVIPAAQKTIHQVALDQMGFVPAGNLTSGTVTSIRMWKNLRRSGDGHAALTDYNRVNAGLSTDTTACRIAPSQEAMKAFREVSSKLDSQYGEASTRRVAEIERQADEHRRMRDQPPDDTAANLIKASEDYDAAVETLHRLQREQESA